MGDNLEDFTAHPLIRDKSADDFNEQYDRSKLLRGLPQHSLLILILTILFALLGSWITYYYLSNKMAEAVMVYQPDEMKMLPGGIPLATMTLPTALESITLPSNIQAVRSRLALEISYKDLAKKFTIPYPKIDSNLITIIAKGNNAIELANTLAQAAEKSSQDFYKTQLNSALYNYRDQLDITKEALSQQMIKIEKFKQENQYFDIDERNTLFISRMLDTRKRLQDANLNYETARIEYDNLKKQLDGYNVAIPKETPTTPKQETEQIDASLLQARLSSTEGALIEAKIRYAPENPRLKILEAEYKRLKDQAAKLSMPDMGGFSDSDLSSQQFWERSKLDLIRLQGRVLASQKIREDMEQSAKELDQKLTKVPAEQVAFSKLLQDRRWLQEQLTFLNEAVEKTQLLLNNPRGSLAVYQFADRVKPLKDGTVVYLFPFVGALFGFLAGLALALAMEVLDKHFRTLKELSLRYSINPFLMIPQIKGLNLENSYDNLLFYIRDISEFLEKTSQERLSHHRLSLALLSTQEGEGKSLIGWNLAKYWARMKKRVLFLEFDTKANPFAKSIKAPPKSIIDYLKGEALFDEVIEKGDVSYGLIKNGDPHLKEMIKSPQMTRFLASVRENYDLVILDCSGVIEDDYAINVAKLADTSLFVISSETPQPLVDSAVKEMGNKGLRPDGIILTHVPEIYVDDERVIKEMSRVKKRQKKRFFLWG